MITLRAKATGHVVHIMRVLFVPIFDVTEIISGCSASCSFLVVFLCTVFFLLMSILTNQEGYVRNEMRWN